MAVLASCSLACTLRAGGSVQIAHVPGRFALRPEQATLAAGSARTLKLTVPASVAGRIAKALGRHAQVNPTVTVRFTPTARGSAPVTLTTSVRIG